jgi:hypothetical protein
MDLRKIGCVDGRWMELAQGRVQWQALVYKMLSFVVLLSEHHEYIRYTTDTIPLYILCS